MRLKNLISNLEPELIQIGDYKVMMVAHVRALEKLSYYNVDAIIADNEEIIKAVLSNDSLYLKPLFIKGKSNRQCDGNYDTHATNALSQKIDFLLKSTQDYENLSLPSDQHNRLLTKILRYLLSRKINLEPYNNRQSRIGYSYPLVEDMSIDSDTLHIIKNLNNFSFQNYFANAPIDKVNICYDCQSSYLNFSECCTKCNSLDLKTEELVHHFRCAYVGPQSDFMKEEKMICPKCDHQLKHIGIDYDKPSEIHTCKSCNHSSQETKMKAKCVDCAKENELDQLVTHEISTYSPTEKAKAFATQSFSKSSFHLDAPVANSTFVNYVGYNLIKAHESKRIHSTTMNTFEMIISFDDSILKNLNQGMQTALIEELASIVQPYLKPNDLITLDNDKNIHALLIDYDDAQSHALNETLDYNLNKMLIDNEWSQTETVAISCQKINP